VSYFFACSTKQQSPAVRDTRPDCVGTAKAHRHRNAAFVVLERRKWESDWIHLRSIRRRCRKPSHKSKIKNNNQQRRDFAAFAQRQQLGGGIRIGLVSPPMRIRLAPDTFSGFWVLSIPMSFVGTTYLQWTNVRSRLQESLHPAISILPALHFATLLDNIEQEHLLAGAGREGNREEASSACANEAFCAFWTPPTSRDSKYDD